MKATSIEEVKKKLHKCGFYNGPIDNEITKEFTAAVAEAQKIIGTYPDGMYGPATDHLLNRYMKNKGI